MMNALFRRLLAFGWLLLLGTAASAQTAPKGRPQPKAKVVINPELVKDGLMMKQGRVILTELGITTPLTADKKLVNGTTITPKGLVTAPDGTTTQMLEGDMVSLTGRVTSHRSMVEADSLLKIKQFDLKYPGKRDKMAKDQEARDKAKAKMAEEKAERLKKAKEKSKK